MHKDGEVDSNSIKLIGTKPAITVLAKDNGLKSNLSSLLKDIGPKPNLTVWKPSGEKQNGPALKPKTQQLNSDKRPEACPQKALWEDGKLSTRACKLRTRICGQSSRQKGHTLEGFVKEASEQT